MAQQTSLPDELVDEPAQEEQDVTWWDTLGRVAEVAQKADEYNPNSWLRDAAAEGAVAFVDSVSSYVGGQDTEAGLDVGEEQTLDAPENEQAPENTVEAPGEGDSGRWIVTDPKAFIRTGPPQMKRADGSVPEGAEVEIVESHERNGHTYSKVEGIDPDSGQHREWGWTAHSNLTDATLAERSEKYATVEGGGGNNTQLAKSREGGNAYTPSELYEQLNGLEGQAYLDAADETIRAKAFTEDQRALLAAARDFAKSPKPLSGAAQANSTIAWSKLSMDGTTVDAKLKQRMDRMQQFIAWAGLVTGPTTRASGMRSPKTAHKLSTAWMFSENNTGRSSSKLTTKENRAELARKLIDGDGRDGDQNQWVSAANVAKVKAAQGDDTTIEALIPALRADAAKVHVQNAVAAEGYETEEERSPNILNGSGVSNHLKGLAVDVFQQWIFPNLFDPMIDSIAVYFGVYRSCKDLVTPEHWHYELLGTPPGPKEGEEAVI